MSRIELRERAIQALALVPLGLLVAALCCPATDLEPPWSDAGPADGGGGVDGGGGDDPAGDAADAPAAGPPMLGAVRCSPPEIAAGSVCVVLGQRSATVRWRTDRAAYGRAECRQPEAVVVTETAAATADPRVVLASLTPAVRHECSVAAVSEEGETPLAAFALETHGTGPWVALTEVLANPVGLEPAQEFVELANLGEEPVDLAGWSLSDEAGGAPLPAGTVLAPGEVALLVADGYEPDAPGDPPAALDARIVRLGRSLGVQGLRNSGEAVFLLDPAGTVVSSYPNRLGAFADGVSVVRAPPESPEADEGAWTTCGPAGPTPGSLEP
ncbi:MAG: lamin tail domain-containing protein [Deltaproteobacteria bacterium]|nr:lamin tail domain-containing protein [Deltaproteobacteria bacterium]